MRFSIWPTPLQSWAGVVDAVTHADATGWDRAYVADHFMNNVESDDDDASTPTLEATAVLSALATLTSRIGLGALVFANTYRHPAVLANWAATADHIADGRLVLGLGAEWQVNEHRQYGIELGRPGRRLARFDEACTVIRSLLTERVTNFSGEHYGIAEAICEPKPLGPMPLLIGGKGDRMLQIVARHADEWNMWAMPDVIAERRAVLDRRCHEVGRDPAGIATSCQALWFVTDAQATADELVANSGAGAIGGPVERLAEHVEAWRTAGVDEIVVPDYGLGGGSARLEHMDAIIEQIAPQFRS